MSRTIARAGALAVVMLAGACAVPHAAGRAPGAPARRWPELGVDAVERPALVAGLRALVAALPPDGAPACLAFRGPPPASWYRPDAGLLAAVARGGRPVVAPADCPPTYDSMVAHVDSAGRPMAPPRPPGYVDPHTIDVRSHSLATPDSAALAVTAGQGTLSRFYDCAARRGPDGAWRARCRLTGQAISSGPAPVPPNVALQATPYAGLAAALPYRSTQAGICSPAARRA